jgi:hypothetical protein
VNVFPKKIALMRNHAIQRHCRLFNSVTDTWHCQKFLHQILDNVHF